MADEEAQACRPILSFCQAVGARRPITFDWTPACSNLWRALELRKLDECIRAPNGWQYRIALPEHVGQSGPTEPKWPKGPVEVVGALLRDGSLTWTAEQPDNDSLRRTILLSTWPAVEGVTIDGDDFQMSDGEQKSWAYVAGATAGTYRIRNPVTFSGEDAQTDVGEVDIVIE